MQLFKISETKNIASETNVSDILNSISDIFKTSYLYIYILFI